MRRRILLAAALLMAVTGYVKAQEPAYITFSQAVLPQGGTGEMEVYYQTDAANAFKAFQIDVPLPEGITIENVEMAQPLPLTGIEKGTYDDLKDMTPEQAKSKFFATAKNKSDKSVVIGFQTGDQTFPASSKPTLLCTLTLKAAETVAVKTGEEWYETKQSESYIELTDASTEKKLSAKQTLKIKVLELGDVNGDGEIGVGDAVCVTNKIIRKPQNNTVFYESVADVNQDEGIGVGDVVSIINIVLRQTPSSQQAPKHRELMLDPQ